MIVSLNQLVVLYDPVCLPKSTAADTDVYVKAYGFGVTYAVSDPSITNCTTTRNSPLAFAACVSSCAKVSAPVNSHALCLKLKTAYPVEFNNTDCMQQPDEGNTCSEFRMSPLYAQGNFENARIIIHEHG